MSIDVMKQALEALEECIGYKTSPFMTRECEAAITALRAAIEQATRKQPLQVPPEVEQAQEPVAWMHPSWIDPDTRGWSNDSFSAKHIAGWVPVYTAPRQWQGLTDEERIEFRRLGLVGVEIVEAKLKEKNT